MKSNINTVEVHSGLLSGFANVIKNILLCFAFTMICLLVFAFIITYTNFPDKFISPIVILFTVISVMLSGMLVARRSASKGWLNGAIAGVLYMVILYCIGSLVFQSFTFGPNMLAMLALGLFAGTFGGIVGINMRRKR